MASASSGRRTAGEWSKLVARWKRSGLSASVFGERHGVAASALFWWSWKLRRDGPGAEVGLVPVTVIEEDEVFESPATRWSMRLPDGTSLEMAGPRSVEGLEAALRALRWDPA